MSGIDQHFYDYLPLNNIICRPAVDNRDDVMAKLLNAMKRHFPQLDEAEAAKEVAAREKIFPTVIAPGLAAPHARITGLKEPLAALAVVPDGVDFSSDMGPVQLVLLILTPTDNPNLHLKIFAELAKRFQDPNAVPEIVSCSTPEEVFSKISENLQRRTLPEYLLASDVVKPPKATLLENHTLHQAIRIFALSHAEELVVLDQAGDLRGVLSLSDLLRYCLPEHLLWMADLSPIYNFQPFSEVLQQAGDTKVADVMREEFITVDAGVPAIQLAKLFLQHKVPQLIITDKKHFAGLVDIRDFSAQLFWE